MTTDGLPPSRHPSVTAFDATLSQTVDAHATALFPTRSLELQRAAAEAFAQLAERAREAKVDAVRDHDEDAASRLLMGECCAEALCERLRLWIAFREGQMDAAWAHLVQAQVAFEAAIRAHPAGAQFQKLAAEMHALEALVFPPQLFLSTGWVTRASECTVCGAAFGTCDHVQGRVYGGEFAGRHVTDAEPREVSVVKVPDDKMCRAFEMVDEGVRRNVLTWEPCETPNEAGAG